MRLLQVLLADLVVNFSCSLALELAPHHIRVNTLLPSVTDTPLVKEQVHCAKSYLLEKIPLGFIADPKELNAVLLLLASNNSFSYMTGSLITIDDGISISPQ